jgi:MarR family transcriptional regulator, lower aerobic nicotinate degradation pathway regulator
MRNESSRYEFLRKVIDLVEEYESGENPQNLALFTLWLNNRVFPSHNQPDQELSLPAGGTLESNIARIVGNLYKYTKQYTKKALQQSPIMTLDDFGFLAYLYFRPAMTKSELIRENLMEISSGTEVIKRLLKSGLIEEFQDDRDSRAKSLRITQFGRDITREVFREMGKVAQIVAGNLSREERIQLLVLLTKLDDFHQQFRHQSGARMPELDVLIGLMGGERTS